MRRMAAAAPPHPLAQPIDLPGVSPAAIVAAWPKDRPLGALLSAPGEATASPWSRWSIIAVPGDERLESPDGLAGPGRAPALTPAPRGSDDHPPFLGGWIGFMSYEAGFEIEPRACRRAEPRDSRWPRAEFRRCPTALVHDHTAGRWWHVGAPEARAGDRGLIASLARLPKAPGAAATGAPCSAFRVGPLRSDTGRAAYERAVARAIEYIRAGDIFQANIAHRLEGSFEGDPRAFFLALLRRAAPWYGAYLEAASAPGASPTTGAVRRAICSISPELFLRFDARTRGVVTRPIKGTRRGGASAGRDLAASAKDAAELVMIVDLMRNDLGRVCAYGSVRVEEARAIERHAAGGGRDDDAGARALHHGVATVSGTLRADASIADLLRAAFPPGSVTGAPKVRAMQIIDELETSPRGPYCGGIGYVSDSGDAAFSVAIRTALVEARAPGATDPRAPWEGVVRYSVGAGIVADSDPAAEWRETLDKAGAFRATAAAAASGAIGAASEAASAPINAARAALSITESRA